MKKIIFLIVIIVIAVVGYIFGKPYYDVYQASSLQNCQFESEKKKVMFHSPIPFKDLGDTLIYNDFDLDFTITAQTSKN